MSEIYNRNLQIIEYIKRHGHAKTEEIAKEFFLSESSVRRIFDALERQGAIKRTHGGATLSESNTERSLNVRASINYEAKRKLALFARDYIPQFSCVFLDNSSTVLSLAHELTLTGKTVVTNGLHLALDLTSNEMKELITLGGVFHRSSTGVYGSRACEALNGFHFDVMIFSCAAFDATSAYESTDEVASFKFISRRFGVKKILIVDGSKFNKSTPCRTAYLNEYDLILTDVPRDVASEIRAGGANIITSSEV